jgi:hypothetical protein
MSNYIKLSSGLGAKSTIVQNGASAVNTHLHMYKKQKPFAFCTNFLPFCETHWLTRYNTSAVFIWLTFNVYKIYVGLIDFYITPGPGAICLKKSF